ncbi:hypothetical protein H2200_002022 [Cladophialophora chaetospira]|uniref:Peptidase metallopeptidase domain-containing protein n=1 Tax=Cladophialophora chaetospira TaxID=386627 RepID=A0AA38XIY8_9EURO|nr:hypothetical protein H2200_002022 [Cladophialophora chaetospira]
MASHGDGNDTPVYVCTTQKGPRPPVGHLPLSAIPGEPSSTHHGSHRVMVGSQGIIPRWDVRTSRPCTLQYYIQTGTFDNPDNLKLTQDLLVKAAKRWNDVDVGVIFAATTDAAKAHFDVVYIPNPEKPTWIAGTFFPNDVDRFEIYPPSFNDPDIRKQLVNTFTHEFGHILGLRHEFAATKEADPSVQIGVMNPNSIMSYEWKTRSFSQSDQDGLKTFYAMNPGAFVGKIAIQDYKPVFVKRG